jgi:hypothetical protein
VNALAPVGEGGTGSAGTPGQVGSTSESAARSETAGDPHVLTLAAARASERCVVPAVSTVARWSRRCLRAILRCAGQQYRRASPEGTSLITFEQPGSAHTACAPPLLSSAAFMRDPGRWGAVRSSAW